MRKLLLLTGAATMMAALPAMAQGQGKGRGHGQEEVHGGNADYPGKGGGDKRPSREKGSAGALPMEHRGDGKQKRALRAADRDDRREVRAERRHDRRLAAEERRDHREERRFAKDQHLGRGGAREDRHRFDREWARGALESDGRHLPGFRRDRSAGASFRDVCPPGLAKKNAFCMPPGQLRKAELIGSRLPASAWSGGVPDRYRYRFQDSDRYYYRSDDQGYLYRLERGSGAIDGIIPLVAGTLLTGEPLPLGYEVYNVPLQYRSLYPDSADSFYRYDEGAIYQVDPQSGLIEGIVALLTGGGGLGGLGIGQELPAGYDVYNLPLDQRDRYVDSDDTLYRYADGNIYQVDAQSRLIEAVISLLS